MTGHPGGPPAKTGIALNDIAGGVTAVQAVLAAYIARLKGEGGQYIDISLLESGVAWTVWEAAAYFGAGEVAAAPGTRHRRNAPYQAFKTKDGYVTVGANTERMWQALCRDVLGRPNGSRARSTPARQSAWPTVTTLSGTSNPSSGQRRPTTGSRPCWRPACPRAR